MRTSRIAKDTAAIIEALSPRKTRSGLASPAASSASSPRTAATRTGRRSALATKAKKGAASPSPTSATSGREIEDIPFDSAPASTRKRKRAGTASNAAAPGAATASQPARRSSRPRRSVPIKDESSDSESNAAAAISDDGAESPVPPSFGLKQQTPTKPPASKPARSVKDPATGAVTIHPPSRWELQWDACQSMRRRILAPVDTVGCDRLHDASMPARDQRYQTLVALMLSPQTKDGVTAAAMERIRAALGPRGFTVAGMLATDEDTLDALINPVGFHRTKARHIRAASAMLQAKHASDVPQEPEALMALPGVGPKIAYLCLAAAWGVTLGIGVDTHVHRITNRWGWHRTSTAEETRKRLEQWLPPARWAAINHMLVGFGQTVCAPIGPRCGECALAEQRICPAASKDGRKARSVLLDWKKKEEVEPSGTALRKVEEGVVKRLDGSALAGVKVEVSEPL